MAAKNKKPKYSDALAELETIIFKLKNKTIDIDELAADVKHALELINICKEKISDAQMQVTKILDESRDSR